METAWVAIKAMKYPVEAVYFLLTILHLILDVLIGTGTLKSALHALNSGFFVQENAREFLLIVIPIQMLLENAQAVSKVSDLMVEFAKSDLPRLLYVNHPTILDLAWAAIMDSLSMEEDVLRLTLFLTSHFTMPLAALKSLLNFKPKEDFQNDRAIFIQIQYLI